MNTECIIANDCKSTNLCCHFCPKTSEECMEKCQDDVLKCRFFFGDKEALDSITPKKKRAPRQKKEKTTEEAPSKEVEHHKSVQQNATNHFNKKSVELW